MCDILQAKQVSILVLIGEATILVLFIYHSLFLTAYFRSMNNTLIFFLDIQWNERNYDIKRERNVNKEMANTQQTSALHRIATYMNFI